MQQLESDLDVTQEKLMNANQRLEEKEKALQNAEGEVAALNRRVASLEEDLEKSEERFFLLLEPLIGIHEFLLGNVKVRLQLLHLLLEIADFLLSLFGADVGILCLLFAGISLVHGIVLVKLHGLHFLFDGLHVEWQSVVPATPLFCNELARSHKRGRLNNNRQEHPICNVTHM